MEIWQFIIGLITVSFTVVATIVVTTWRFAWKLAEARDELVKSMTDMNNTMLTALRIAESNLGDELEKVVQKFDARTLEIERDLAQFKAYCERVFVSKETFNIVMAGQSNERNAMKAELLDRLNRIEQRLTGGGAE